MTRVNLIPPRELMDQHLIAEIKEINQLAGSFRRSKQSKNGINTNKIPKQFTLNTGHVTFFYDKGKYLHNRFNSLVEEARIRHFNISAQFNNEWKDVPELYNDWTPTDADLQIIQERIRIRIQKKPNWYKYYGQSIQ